MGQVVCYTAMEQVGESLFVGVEDTADFLDLEAGADIVGVAVAVPVHRFDAALGSIHWQ